MISYFTDGSASPNPGPGGYAVIKGGKPHIIGGEPSGAVTTNIRMEGLALLAALKDANGVPCQISTDSEFWINVITKWGPGWQQNNWVKKSGEIKNLDIVKEIVPLHQKSAAELIWVRAHVGTELNELADQWANEARRRKLTHPVRVAAEAQEHVAVPAPSPSNVAAADADKAWEHLAKAKVMQLATSAGKDIWAASVYFVADPSSRTICWLSEPGRRHSKLLADNPRAAFAVAVKPDMPVVGVQGAGNVQIVDDTKVADRVMQHYIAKYGEGTRFVERHAKRTNKHNLYALIVDDLQLFDER
jgi:ribonuclease HI